MLIFINGLIGFHQEKNGFILAFTLSDLVLCPPNRRLVRDLFYFLDANAEHFAELNTLPAHMASDATTTMPANLSAVDLPLRLLLLSIDEFRLFVFCLAQVQKTEIYGDEGETILFAAGDNKFLVKWYR